MFYDPQLAEIRFGIGPSPARPAPRDAAEMLARLAGPDTMARRHPYMPFSDLQAMQAEFNRVVKVQNKQRGTAEGDAAAARVKELRRAARLGKMDNLNALLRRAIDTEDGFREHLTLFWADHFTTKGKKALLKEGVSFYVEDAIRPHVAGDFATMLKAVVMHPMMLLYLDQITSIGPNSKIGQQKNKGLNENLAREVLELHTLGVEAEYSQTDVRQLAELFTGMTVDKDNGFTFRLNYAEPGAETVLGKSYGGPRGTVADIEAALDDLARHPATARHIARKLATHFVSDTPDEGLVDHVAARYIATGGALMPTYEALLEHPAAWVATPGKVRQPVDFVAAAVRALNVPLATLEGFDWRDVSRQFVAPMQLMGQDWESPIGPDGWPEEAEAWITPQGMAARIQWAMKTPEVLMKDLPDPRDFLRQTLGARASEPLTIAAAAAENRATGIGLVLVSPEFQRR